MTTAPEREQPAQWRNINPRQFWLRGRQPDNPVEFDDETRMWDVYGYPEAVHALGDPATFSSDTGRLVPIEDQFSEGNVLQMDPPEHNTLRKLVGSAFSPRIIAGLEPRIRELTNELLDEVADPDRFELVTTLTYPLPVIVIAELLGVPSSDRHLFKQWVDQIFEQPEGFTLDKPTEESTKNAIDQLGGLLAYLREHVIERRKRPRRDLLTRLVEAEVDGDRLSDTEVANFANVLLVAGHITTTMLLGNAVLCLDVHPHARDAVRADRTKLPAMIEESLRFLSPFASVARVTNRETELGGRTIPADQLVMIWLAAANRDPRVFDRPDAFDVYRDPNPHIAFSRGVHFCIGTQLARLEGRVAMNVLLDRFPTLRSDPDDAPRFQPSPYMTGVTRLMLNTTLD